jgi:hypothetical protein
LSIVVNVAHGDSEDEGGVENCGMCFVAPQVVVGLNLPPAVFKFAVRFSRARLRAGQDESRSKMRRTTLAFPGSATATTPRSSMARAGDLGGTHERLLAKVKSSMGGGRDAAVYAVIAATIGFLGGGG